MNRVASNLNQDGSGRTHTRSSQATLGEKIYGVRAELRKALTLRSVWILSVAVLLFVTWNLSRQFAVLGQEFALNPNTATVELAPGDVETIAQVFERFSLASVLQASTVLFMFGLIVSRQEYRHGQLSISLLAMPRRTRTYWSKMVAVAVVSTGFTLILLTVVNVEIILLADRAETSVLFSQQTVSANLRLVLFINCINIVAMSLCTIARNAVVPMLFFLAAVVLTGNTTIPGATAISPWLLYSAGTTSVFGRGSTLEPLFAGQDTLTLIVWPLLTAVIGNIAFVKRDVA